MSMNYYEKLVMKDKAKEGYDMVKQNGDGLPDFKVFNFETGEKYWLEVKNPSEFYTDNQKETFPKITIKIIIAVVGKGEITYKDYKTGEIISTSSYSKLIKVEPNITCGKCNHAWFTTTKMYFVSCPNCYKKVQVQEFLLGSKEDKEKTPIKD